MLKSKFLGTAILVILLVLPACNLPVATGEVSEPGQEPTIPVETQAAVLVSTLYAQTALANTQAAVITDTPEFTFTPSQSPTATFTLTPSKPMVSVSVATNCRSGPTTAYELLGVLQVGETAEVIGRSVLTDTMIIRLPSNPAITCWLWAKNASVAGDTSGLPIIPIPATATPVASFEVVYSSTQYCLGLYRHKFQITNNGSITWESDRITVTDQNISITTTATWDEFPYYSAGCAKSADLNLEGGEVGFTTSDGFAINPSGHDIVASILVCSQNGLAGTCLEKTITFTP